MAEPLSCHQCGSQRYPCFAQGRARERAILAKMLRDHVQGRATEHDAGVRYAASLIEKITDE